MAATACRPTLLTRTEAILAALTTAHWNRKHAARLLNLDYKAFLYKMKKLGISRNTLRAWQGYAKSGDRKAEFRKVTDALKSLQIGPDEEYLIRSAS